MSFLLKLRKSEVGAAAIEFALAIPLIIMLFYGVAQYGIIMLANSGIRHAVDVSARAATVYIGVTPMTDTQLRAVITSNLYGINRGTVSTPSISRGKTNGIDYVDISVTYTAPIDLIFFKFGPMSLTESRRAYLP